MPTVEPGSGVRQPLAITASGMVTGVGLYSASACAAIRANINNFQETGFTDSAGEWILGSEVPLEKPWRGVQKLVKMLAGALEECAELGQTDWASTPVLVCLSERERPGRTENLASQVMEEVQKELGIRFHPRSLALEHGRAGAMVALHQARSLIYDAGAPKVLVAGVDSLLNRTTLRAYEKQHRLLTSENNDGFIPGEAAAAVLVERPQSLSQKQLLCQGMGFGFEEAGLTSGKPLRADGLVTAIKASLTEASTRMENLNFRIADVSGEQYWFKESSLALLKTMHTPQDEFDIWHPADCIGEVGAAIGPVVMAVGKSACEKGYSPGPDFLCHFSNLDGKRAAAVFSYRAVGESR